ncbi:MAG: TonB-dependent receptor [Arenibacter algicola]
MKSIIFLFCSISFALSPVIGEAQNAEIIIDSDITLNVKQVFRLINKQTDYKFIYRHDLIKSSPNIDLKKGVIKAGDLLDKALSPISFTYNFTDRGTIVVKKMPTNTDQEGSIKILEKKLQFQVSGTVTDNEGLPLSGANVLEKGTSNGVIADFDGNFTISVKNENAVLVISYIGFANKEVSIDGQTSLQITLEESAAGLDEVVVVGYGSQKKATITGSVVAIDNEEINTSTTTNLADNLAGKLPGLRVMARTSEPGSYDTNFDIRGWGSPLIIVDGIIRGDNFGKIDPNEIESISVIKDAAAAVYGVKAANGVILVTTKKGKEGKLEVTYTGTYGNKHITDFPKPMTAAQYTESFNWALVNANQPIEYSAEQVEAYKSGELLGTNWQDLAMNNSAPQQQHNLSFNGGNDKFKFFTSLGYFDEEGLFKAGDLNYARYNLRSNIEVQLTDNLTAELRIGAIADKKDSPSYWIGGIFKGLWMQKPVFNVYANDTEPFYQNMADGNHPLVVTNSDLIGNTGTKNKTFQGTLSLSYKVPFVDGLSAKFLYAYDYNNFNEKAFDRQYNLYDYDAASASYITSGNNSPSEMSVSYAENEISTTQFFLNYDKVFNEDHHVSGLLLYEYLKEAYDNFSGSRQFSVDVIEELYAGNSRQFISSDPNNIFETNNQGIVGRVNYDFRSKYLIEGSFRYDGSSMFPKDKRWGFFPSASVGWRISEENFIKDNLAKIDNLKIRASYGKMGDDSAARFQFVPGYIYPTTETLNGRPLGSVIGGNFVTGLGSIGMINPDITWFTATTSNLGLDASLWHNQLTLNAEIFRRKRDGLLATRVLSLPQSVGASLPQENLNSDISKGFEVQVGTTQRVNDLTVSLSGMMSYAKTRWDFREEAVPGNSYLKWKNSNSGRNTNIIWGYDDIGQYQNQEEINAHLINIDQRFVLPGDYIFRDVNSDGMLSDLDVIPIAQGNTNMGSQAIPEISYGFNMSLKWNGFDMNVLFQGATNYSVRLIEQLQNPYPWGRNGLSQFYDSWHRADFNDPNSAWVPGKYAPARIGGPNPSNRTSMAYNIKDASYLRLKSLEVGYTLSNEVLSQIGIKNCRLFVNGFNLATWSKLDFMDPEHPQDQYGYMYPLTSNVNLGLNVSF